jgi:hypothetical protein
MVGHGHPDTRVRDGTLAPVAAFLSPEWLAELDAAAVGSTHFATARPQGTFVVEQWVTDVPGGDACYHVVIGEAGTRVVVGPAPEPDLRLITDYATAVALQRSEINAQEALATGHMKFRGDLEALVRHRDALAAVDDVFVDVRARTTYPHETSASHR